MPSASASKIDATVECPEPVRNVVPTAGVNEVSLTWELSDDGGPVEGVYIEVVSPESKVVAIPGRVTSGRVSGLRNGVEVTLRVIAASPAGSAAPSGIVAATPTTGMEGEVAGLIVEFEPGTEPESGTANVPGEERVDTVDLTVAQKLSDDSVLVEMSAPVALDKAEEIALQLEADPRVAWAEPDAFLFTAGADMSAWNLSGSWSVDSPQDPKAGQGVTVAVIDTGITAHPDLDNRLAAGYDFVSNPEQLMASRQPNAPPVAFDADYADETAFGSIGRDSNPADPGDWRDVTPVRASSWHGTQIAGVISSVVPGAKIQPIRALSWRGGLLSDIAASITWASGGMVDGVPVNANPSKVINMSFSTETICPVALQDAIDAARARGSILVAAAGNAGDDAAKYAPGNCNGVITVGATNSDGTRAEYSNYGPTVDLAAPGGDFSEPVSTMSNTGLTNPSASGTSSSFGTSVAAAHVAAGAAMLAGGNLGIAPDDAFRSLTGREYVKHFSMPTCDANPDYTCGTGILSLAQTAAAACTRTEITSAGYIYIAFAVPYATNTSCTSSWTPPVADTAVEYLVVAGGGGGGVGRGGGGGAGGFLAGSTTMSSVTSVHVGQGGIGGTYASNNGTQGANSSLDSVIASGGGGGGGWNSGNGTAGGAGGSGGGASGSGDSTIAAAARTGGSGVSGQGKNGGSNGISGSCPNWADTGSYYCGGGGGGGASSLGGDGGTLKGGDGGAGSSAPAWLTATARTALGIPAEYSGGGGGGGLFISTSTTGGAGGSGGGGAGCGGNGDCTGTSGAAKTGGGGGGGEGGGGAGGQGGTGLVVIRYASSCSSSSTASGEYTVVTFSNPGTCSWTAPAQVGSVDVLAVGGGGGGGAWLGGGGGGGGVTASNALTVTPGSSYNVTVGVGGSGARMGPGGTTAAAAFVAGTNGGSSSFGSSVTALGGGVGATDGQSMQPAGTGSGVATGGGGSTLNYGPGTGTVTAGGAAGKSDQPHPTGGGGGAGGNGVAGASSSPFASGAGGAGKLSSITGSDAYYGGGGGGSAHGTWPTETFLSGTNTPGAGGAGGGGAGGQVTTAALNTVVTGEHGTDGQGGGGGGSANYWIADTTYGSVGGDGGDGTVIVRYLTNSLSVASGAGVQPGNYTSVGWLTPPKVQLVTASGTSLATSGVSITATFSASSGSATLVDNVVTTVNGVADFSGMTVSGNDGTTGTLTFTAAGYGPVTSTSFSIVKEAQSGLTITSTHGTFGVALPLTTSGGSGTGAVTFAVSNDTALGCTESGGSLTVTQAGTCLVTATKAGDETYDSVSSPQTTVTFAKASQSALAITSQSSVVYGNTFTLTSSGGSGTGAIDVQKTGGSATCSISNNWPSPSTLTGTGGAGSFCEIVATKEADLNYQQVLSPAQNVTVTARPIAITASDSSVTYPTAITESFSITSGSLGFSDAISGMTFTYVGTGSTSYGPSTTAPTVVGTYSVTPSAAVFSTGSASNYTILYTSGTVTIARGTQTIAFGPIANKTYGAEPFSISASSDSGLAVTLTSTTTDVCAVSGTVVTIVGSAVGGATCSIRASQAGNANVAAAADVTQTFTVSQASQASLNMSSPSTAIYGQTIALAATGGSGTGALSFAVTSPIGPGLCSLSGMTLTLGNAGSLCTVQATKQASANYLIATSAHQTITITQAGQTVAFTSDVPETPERFDTYTPTASAISTVTGQTSGIAPSFAASGNCTIAAGVVTFGLPGTCTITAAAGSNTNFAAATNVTQTIVIGSTNQTIDFTQPSNVAFGSASVAMSATTSSGGDVTFALGAGTTNSACAVSSLGTVTILAVGTCEVVASAAAFDQFAAASDVTRAFQVVAALAMAPTLTSGSASSQAVTVGFTAPGFTGGVSITAYELVATPVTVGADPVVTSTACAASPCTIPGLVNGVAYRVKVAAINSAGTGAYSGSTGPLTPATAAFAVGALTATPGDGFVDISWTQPADLGGGTFVRYDLYRREVGGTYGSATVVGAGSIGTTTARVTGLSNGTSYEFKVVTITEANSVEIPGGATEVDEYPSTEPTAPRTPTVLAATATEVQFSWAAPVSDGGAALSATPYTVTVTGSAGAAAVTCIPVGANTYCTASNLTNDASYVFSVVATNRMGNSPAATVTYNVPSSVDTLSALEVIGSGGVVSLSPSFASGTTDYTASVANGVASVTVNPTTTSAGATVTVNGVSVLSGAASAPIMLAVGATTITIVVTASDPRHTETYTIVITRAAASSNGGGSWSPPAGQPVIPPASVRDGTSLFAVLQGGQLLTGMSSSKTASRNGWTMQHVDFSLTVAGLTASGSPSPVGDLGQLRVPQGGRVDVVGDGYAPSTEVAVFAIPRGPVARLAPRSSATSVYLGSTRTSATGRVDEAFGIPADMSIGAYVLQINGTTPGAALQSMNILMDVIQGATTSAREGTVRKAAFFQPRSARFTKAGLAKLRSVIAAIPKQAQGVTVSIVGVSVSGASATENLDLARDRAKRLSQFLERNGVEGQYTVAVSTTFTVGSTARQVTVDLSTSGDATPGVVQPSKTPSGKALSTVSVAYSLPGPANT